MIARAIARSPYELVPCAGCGVDVVGLPYDPCDENAIRVYCEVCKATREMLRGIDNIRYAEGDEG